MTTSMNQDLNMILFLLIETVSHRSKATEKVHQRYIILQAAPFSYTYSAPNPSGHQEKQVASLAGEEQRCRGRSRFC